MNERPGLPFDSGHATMTLRLMLPPGAVVEVRALGTRQGTQSGYFNDVDAALAAARALSGRAEGVYLTINPVDRELLHRAWNRVLPYARVTTTDDEVTRRRWLPVDVDPVRPRGVSATEEERQRALDRAREIRRALVARGWPVPALASSGNGAHLLFPTDLANSADVREELKAALMFLASEFSTETCSVDASVFNAARILRFYGTLAMKGEPSATRPHRVAQFVDVPRAYFEGDADDYPRLTEGDLAQFNAENRKHAPVSVAGHFGRRAAGAGIAPMPVPERNGTPLYDLRKLDVAGLFRAHDSYYVCVSDEGGMHAVRCPWAEEHSTPSSEGDTDTVVWDGRDGRLPGFRCLHAHCVHRRLQEVVQHWDDAAQFGARERVATGYALTDDGNGNRLVDRYGKHLRHTHEMGGWLYYEGGVWHRGASPVVALATDVILGINEEASQVGDGARREALQKHGIKSQSWERINACVKVAANKRDVQARAEQFDANPWLLNCLNGAVDLRTGELKSPMPEHYCTRQVPHVYDPDADCPRFRRFLREVLCEDDEMERFVLDLLGYCLTGSVREQVLPIFWGSGSNGKALAVSTCLPTPTGWTTMGEVKVGDELFDECGNPCRVVAATDAMVGRPCYRVRFWGGGEIVADADHQWLVNDHQPKSHGRRNSVHRSNQPVVLTTREMALDFEAPRDCRFRYSIDLAEPLQLPEVALPIHPYVLGVWLGDGHSNGSRVTNPDEQIRLEIEAAGYSTNLHSVLGDKCCAYGVGVTGLKGQPRGAPASLQAMLRRLGLLNNKHVPDIYLRGSVEQRLALLQGLMDTDGSVSATHGQCQFGNTNPKLRDAVMELARSLGLRPTCRTTRSKLNGKDCGEFYIVQFHAYTDLPCFRLERKRDRLTKRPARHRRRSGRWSIESIEPISSVPVRCVQVDSPSRLYLAGKEMVPTHNSTLFGTMQRLMGDYATTAAPNLLVEAKAGRHPTEVADLRGRRLVVSSEVGEGRRLAEDLVKQLTGGDRIKARFMRGDFFEFDPTFTIILGCNHRPMIRGTDDGIWRRLPLVPFQARFVDQAALDQERDRALVEGGTPSHVYLKDPGLLDVLTEELPGILALLVRRAQRWCEHPLVWPTAVRAASRGYRENEDLFGTFLDDRCEAVAGAVTAAADLYAAYCEWAVEMGEHACSQRRFGAALTERGFQREKRGTYRWHGIRLAETAPNVALVVEGLEGGR